jgi:general L-amino acid transport system permease protein
VAEVNLSTPRSRLFAGLFGTPLNAGITIALALLVAALAPHLLRWTILDAAFLPAEPSTCQAARGACWSFVIAKHSQILFGIYPSDERWRPALVCLGLLGLLGYSIRPSAWRKSLAWIWAAMMVAVLVLMRGDLPGLPYVPTAIWGGLPVTLILTVIAIGVGFVLAIVLALARRSTLPAVRIASVMFIETTRALPLLSILFIASIMLPLLVPEALLPDKFFRALIALLLFSSAYIAEVIRGGLQGIPRGQFEASQALGLSYWQMHRFVVLPQAIRMVVPSLTNTIIIMIKNTSLVLVVGLFDLISSGKAALADPAWNSPAVETYVFIAAIYFGLCFSFGRFADRLERRNKVAT